MDDLRINLAYRLDVIEKITDILGRDISSIYVGAHDLLKMIEQQQKEIEQYKLQEKLLLERLKRAERMLPVTDKVLAKVRYSDADDQY